LTLVLNSFPLHVPCPSPQLALTLCVSPRGGDVPGEPHADGAEGSHEPDAGDVPRQRQRWELLLLLL